MIEGVPEVHRAAVRAWAESHSTLDVSFRRALLGDWVRLARHPRYAARFLFGVFSILARHATSPPGPSLRRRVARTLLEFPEERPASLCERVLSEATADGQLLEQLKRLRRTLRAGAEARRLAAVDFDDMRPRLELLLRVFYQNRLPPSLGASSGPERDRACTDGSTIKLPQSVTLTPERSLNEWFYVRLLAHEVEHVRAGSLNVSFTGDDGPQLLARLASRQAIFERNSAEWSSADLLSKLQGEGRAIPAGFAPKLPDLLAVFLHYERPRAVHGLFAITEDARIERRLAIAWPGLGRIAHRLRSFEVAGRRSLRFLPPIESLHSAIFERALGLGPWSKVPPAYALAWKEVKRILDAFRLAPDRVGQSVIAALDIHEALERTLTEPDWEYLQDRLEQAPLPAIDEAKARRDLERRGPGDVPQGIKLPERDPSLPGPYALYPEYDCETARLEPAVVQVREERWEAQLDRKHDEEVATAPECLRGLSGIAGNRLGSETFWSEASGEADPARVHDLITSLRAGHDADRRLCRIRSGAPRGLSVAFLLDLSVSMEHGREDSAARGPLARALRYCGRAVPSLVDATTGIFGLHDNGRRPVNLHIIQEFGEPYDGPRLASVHALWTGGFRYGAGLRHLAARMERECPGDRHVIVVLTDAGNHYSTPGVDRMREFGLKSCLHCAARRCSVEPWHGQTPPIGSGRVAYLYQPFRYELEDVYEARTEIPDVRCLFIMLEEGYSTDAMDRHFGSGNWRHLLQDADIGRECEWLLDAVVRSADPARN